jgi:hypothetical protein
MGINVFQINALNTIMLGNPHGGNNFAGPYASEYPIQPDNINGQLSRYTKLFSVWGQACLNASAANPVAGSYGQDTGTGLSPLPAATAGSYFIRGVWFTNGATPGAVGGFRDGYIGCFNSGMQAADYVFDINTLSIDYEPLYGHGSGYTWPEGTSINSQFFDSTFSNPLSDQSLTCTSVGSAFTRTPYMPPVYHRLYAANSPAGSQTLGSGNVKFFFEERPTLRAAGFNDGNANIDNSSSTGGSSIYNQTNSGGPYSSSPLRGQSISNPATNPLEYFQVTGVRKLNSRGLGLHLGKVFDNGWSAIGYPFEEDGGLGLNGPDPANYEPVNVQTEYLWQRGQDFPITSSSVTSNVATFQCANNFVAGQQLILNGFSNEQQFNGQVLVVLSAGLSSSQFSANWNQGNYSAQSEPQPSAVASYNPDLRIRQNATFVINEEYYGFVSDTKCTIWSNKSSMIPLLFFDLADTWTGSTAPRIAGATVTGVNPGNITSVQVTSNVVTVTCDNNYQNGQYVYIQGLSGATFLNGQTLQVLTSTPFQFTAAFTNANYGPTTDSGSAGGYKVWFLSEDGILAVYDFTQYNGALSLVGNNAPAIVNVGAERYGALRTNAQGTLLYAVYGTTAADPRLTSTSPVTPHVGIITYNISGGTWGDNSPSFANNTVSYMPNMARHNGRSLGEFIVLRDGRLAGIVEEVAYSSTNVTNVLMPSGTPGFNITVAGWGAAVLPNIQWQVTVFDPVANVWNSSIIDGVTLPNASPVTAYVNNISSTPNGTGSTLTCTLQTASGGALTTAFPTGATVLMQFSNEDTGNLELSGQLFTVTSSSTTQIVGNLLTYDGNYSNSAQQPRTPGNPVWQQAFSIAQGIQYGTNTAQTYGGGTGQVLGPADPETGWWFFMPNASLHDVAPNRLLVQGNWTASNLWVLNISGSTASTSNSNLTPFPASQLWSYNKQPWDNFYGVDGNVPNNVNPATAPVSFSHARDYATNVDRTLITLHVPVQQTYLIYQAPPGYNWTSPTNFAYLGINGYNGNGLASWSKDATSVSDLTSDSNNDQGGNWQFPVQTNDNYTHYVRVTGQYPNSQNATVYGGNAMQSILFLPTYHKWVGNSVALSGINIAVASDVLTVSATNTFNIGDKVKFSGLTNATFLNGMTVYVTSSSGGSFTANFVYPAYSASESSGTAAVQWKIADNFADASANPYTVTGAGITFPLPYGLAAQFGPSNSDTFKSNGVVSTVSNIGWSGTTLTVTYSNTQSFQPAAGDVVTFNELSPATFLNGRSFVVNSGVTSTTFTCNIEYGSYGPTAQTTGTVVDISDNGSTLTHSEYFTFNMCWGNTKFARSARFAWALFAGQTFLQTDARTMAEENAATLYFVDTDQSSVAVTQSPMSLNPVQQTATVTQGSSVTGYVGNTGLPALPGYVTGFGWPKLDTDNYPYDTPLQIVLTANNFPPTSNVYDPVEPFAGPPFYFTSAYADYSWTVGSNTYTATASGEQNGWNAWQAFAGSPQYFWNSNTGNSGYIQIQLPAAQTVLGYSFRPMYNINGGGGGVVSAPKTWTLQGSNNGSSWTTVDTQSVTSWQRGMAFTCASPGSYSYYRMNITASSDSGTPWVGMFQLYNAARSSTLNFTDLTFFNYGWMYPSASTGPSYLQLAHMARGLTFEVSMNGGSNYTTITPLWRAHLGYAYSFTRQTNVTNLRITVQQGYNWDVAPFGGFPVYSTAAFGPFYLFDYNGAEASSRLGSNSAPVDTAPAGTFDPQCLGVATDAMSLSLDSGSPSAFSPQFTAYMPSLSPPYYGYPPVTNQYWQTLGFWSMQPVPPPSSGISFFKAHPFFGFLLFQGAGNSGAPSQQTGTDLEITYHWGRRV